MAAITENDLRKYSMRTNRPIPGQSLTNDPDTPAPFERPPEFTTKDDAINYFFKMITSEEGFPALMELLANGIPVMDIVEAILTRSFQDGLINPDMVLLLAEPLAYILLGLSEREGIKAKIVQDDGTTDTSEDDENLIQQNILRSKLQTITNPQDDKEVPMKEKIEALPSLMDRGE